MTFIEFADGELSFTFRPYGGMTKVRVTSCPAGQHAKHYGLDHEQVKDLIDALQVMERDMRPREEARKSAEQMARDLHSKGWTFKRFSDTMHPAGPVVTSTVIGDIADELSRLEKEGAQ